MTFWETFNRLCETKGKKPHPVGKELGIASATITQWKNGSIPSGEKLILLSEYFGVTTDYLLGNETAGTKPTDEDIKFALFDGTEGVTDEMYEEVKRFAKFIKEQKEKK